MSLVVRIWTAMIGVIAATLGVLSILCILQHDAILSQLIRQRLAVTVEVAARPFRSVVELGLPVSMMRNKLALLERARASDTAISDVVLFNPTGIVIEQSGSGKVERVTQEIVDVQAKYISRRWGLETDRDLISGTSILDDDGVVLGGILAVYPKSELDARSASVAQQIVVGAMGLFVLFTGIAYLMVRARVDAAGGGLRRLEGTLVAIGGTPTETPAAAGRHNGRALPEQIALALSKLQEQLEAASEKYRRALQALGSEEAEATAHSSAGPREVVPVGVPERAATRSFARRLTPVIAVLTLGSSLTLGYLAYLSISDSFRPEIARRTQLIGSIATTDIQRTVEAGVPVEGLVGAGEYFGHLLADFPEISYFAVLTDRPVIEVGQAQLGGGADRTVFPILVDGVRIGELVTETNLDYIAAQFRDVVLDLGVVVLVILLFAFELIVVMMSRSVTGPLDRLQHLAELQAAGDFSKRLVATGRNVVERLGSLLSERAERLNVLAAAAIRRSAAGLDRSQVVALEPEFRLSGRRPAVMRFCSLTDVRLPLFLFAMADELPLSFFSLYARAQANPFTSLGEGVVIGLPLAAYLGAALLGALLARPLGQRMGYRRLFIAAALATFFAKLGLCLADNIIEVIVSHGINGLAFALASLACQDYVLDMLPKGARSRSISLFRATLFSGVFAATALGGILADRLGQRPVFAACAVLSVVSAFLIWRMLPVGGSTPHAEQSSETEDKLSFNILAPMRSPIFAAVALGSVIPLAIVDHVFISYLLALQMDALGASISEIARVMMFFFLALILGGYAEGRLPTWLAAPSLLLTTCSITTGVSLLIAGLFPSTWSTLAASIGAGIALGLAGGPQTTLVMDAAEGPLAHLGTSAVLGTIRVIERGGAITGLMVIGSMTDTAGYSGAAGIIGMTALAGAGLFAVLRLAGSEAAISGRSG
ncbi:MFS transporter [Ensifer sp. LCM 4579]|uniref:MFS transporter n=1 Tax=Ensifer sp. LCM 4579 TaxID=1848292 RepID=UPI0008DB0F13|nr:MFS transporter [Ensifer sp. LCM 4579]OHV81374.1 hypothetical protein LCM4579_20295 [Ensifer sp. LCM 4579]